MGKTLLLRWVMSLVCVLLWHCGSSPEPQVPEPKLQVSKPSKADAWFTDQAAASGLDFVHDNGMTGAYHFPEIMGSGGALLDYDGDGDLDVYLCQGQRLEGKPNDNGGRLYRNDSEPNQLRFTDVTPSSGIVAREFGMGAASADFDNDGWPDLYLLNYGPNKLLRNLGNGRFEDVTQKAGASDARWSVSATFSDFDRDGWLDLFIVNYVDYTTQTNKDCTLRGQDYCNPQSYQPVPDRLLRNLGNGQFEDVTAKSQIATSFGNGLGVISFDWDQDGWPDFYVANDGMPNQLWHNLRNGRFEEAGLLSGSALNLKGVAEASMGISAGDYDGDGDSDLFMTHLRSETNTLFQNLSESGQVRFRDQSIAANLAASSRSLTGFGTQWFDADNDGWLDLFVTNGSVAALEDLAVAGNPFPYTQADQFFRNRGDGQFEDLSLQAGEAVVRQTVGRGAMFGDLDNDGDTDIIVNDNHGPVRLLRNDKGASANWLGVRLIGGGTNPRDMLGARIVLHTRAGRQLMRQIQTDGSYAVANDPRVLFGLGNDTPQRLEVRWPDATQSVFPLEKSRVWLTFRQGDATVQP